MDDLVERISFESIASPMLARDTGAKDMEKILGIGITVRHCWEELGRNLEGHVVEYLSSLVPAEKNPKYQPSSDKDTVNAMNVTLIDDNCACTQLLC